jgi:predicted MPP superfamily phosphohydrolase
LANMKHSMGKCKKTDSEDSMSTQLPKISRRTLVAGSMLLASACLAEAAMIRGSDTTELLEINHHMVKIPALPSSFSEYRIGFVSDIHLGISVRTEFVAFALEQLIASDLDILVLGGDLIWYGWQKFSEFVAPQRNREFSQLSKSSRPNAIMNRLHQLLKPIKLRDGILAVPGNHDRRFPDTISLDPLRSAGVRFLVNSSATVKRGDHKLTFEGVDDYWRGRPVVPKLKSVEPRILLCHNPDFILDILQHLPCQFDLALCGHTHGGQIRLPPFGISPLWRTRDKRLIEGFHSFPQVTSFTSRGLGVSGSFNYRIDCKPEVNVFTLTS